MKMPKLVEFRDKRGNVCYVAPDDVKGLSVCGDDGTLITTSGGRTLVVAGTVERAHASLFPPTLAEAMTLFRESTEETVDGGSLTTLILDAEAECESVYVSIVDGKLEIDANAIALDPKRADALGVVLYVWARQGRLPRVER